MIPVVIVGAGGHGREALDIILALNRLNPTYNVLGFVDDGRRTGSKAHPHELPIIGDVQYAQGLEASVVVAIGQPAARRSIVEKLGDREYLNLVHPEATIGSHVEHGSGLIMAAGARITHAVRLGHHVHLNIDASVSHDCRVGDFATITPGARLSGAVTLGSGVWMGVNSSVIQGVEIGSDVVVGAGAAVIDDLPEGVIAVGVPAKPLTEGSVT